MGLNLEKLETRWEKLQSPIARDLKLNFKKIALDSSLSETETALITLAAGRAVGARALSEWAKEALRQLNAGDDAILEAEESAALMGMLNTYYKFRGFLSKAEPSLAAEKYAQAGLRMTSLARPALGKNNFELLALAVSLINGCETCVTSHERVLRQNGTDPVKIHDAVRLTAVIKGLSQMEEL